jgi:hypothetical protein
MAPAFCPGSNFDRIRTAVVCATITTVRQLDKQTWHASDRLPDGGKSTKYPS